MSSDFVVDDDVIRVSNTSNPSSVASVIARAVDAGRYPKLRAIGASSVNQATKACAIARGFVAPKGIDLTFIIGFDDVKGESGDSISAITWKPIVR
jgi:stage V sporulation protein S